MKTIGEILKKTREERKLTLEQVESVTKIRKKFLQAIEEDDWKKISSITYTQGFIKNYAQFLGLDINFVLAIFRRQFNSVEKLKIMPSGLAEPLNVSFWRLTPSKIIAGFVIILLVLFFSWLFSQYQAYVWAPRIVIAKPQENEVIKGTTVEIIGKTDPWAKLTINGQEVSITNGQFNQVITVMPGTVTINIDAINKFGKKQEVTRTIKVESP